MNATLPSETLEIQHREIDRGIEPILKGGTDVAALARALELLRLHLYLEEEILFPVLERTGLMMPIFVMKREHGEMWPLMEKLAAACAAGAAAASLRRDCDELFKQLKVHNPKEEQVVYSAADNVAAKGEGESLVATMDAADITDGWTCAMAPR